MSELLELAPTSFNESLREFVERIDYRQPANEAERDAIYRLRFRAYDRARMLTPGVPEQFTDRYDHTPNATTVGLYMGPRLMATIRVHVADDRCPVLPSLQAYEDILRPLLDSGKTLVDPTRHVVDSLCAREFPRLPYATIRVPWMACEHFDADYVLATIPLHHRAFYRRVFGPSFVSEPREYPGIAMPIVLLVLNFKEARADVYERYPYLMSTERERAAVFARTRI